MESAPTAPAVPAGRRPAGGQPAASVRRLAGPARGARLAGVVDVGSTFTKAAVVDVDSGVLLATAAHPTTVGTDVLHGLDAALGAAAAALGGVDLHAVYACSSAGGGLRLAVVGFEKLISAEAGHRVALSAGARVVHVAAGRLDGAGVAALRASRPDVLLLVGGTDGGDAEVIAHNAARLARARLRRPVVVAGNVEVRDHAVRLLSGAGVPVVAADNVLPSLGVLNPGPARAAIREVFLRHVIGGKKLSRGPRFSRLVRGATPDVVLTAVELLGERLGGDLVVVDVGGATTDVYSVLSPDARPTPEREAAGVLWHARTVEGDLGVRHGATGIVAAAVAERLIAPDDPLAEAAARRARDPGLLPQGAADAAADARLATLAATVALRRHARGEALVAGGPRRGGKDLSAVRLLVGSGGVLRHAAAGVADRVLADAAGDHAGGWAVPRQVSTVVDRDYVLAAVGLLAGEHPLAAAALLDGHLAGGDGPDGRYNHSGGLAGRHADNTSSGFR